MKTVGWTSLVLCVGCATVGTWEETGRAEMRISDVRIAATNGVASAVKVIGEKSVPVMPFVWSVSSEGIVDQIGTVGGGGGMSDAVSEGCHAVLVADLNR